MVVLVVVIIIELLGRGPQSPALFIGLFLFLLQEWRGLLADFYSELTFPEEPAHSVSSPQVKGPHHFNWHSHNKTVASDSKYTISFHSTNTTTNQQ
jgi:hypothetical protein